MVDENLRKVSEMFWFIPILLAVKDKVLFI